MVHKIVRIPESPAELLLLQMYTKTVLILMLNNFNQAVQLFLLPTYCLILEVQMYHHVNIVQTLI